MAVNNIGTVPVQIASPSLTSGEITFIQQLAAATAYNEANVVLMNRNNGGSAGQVLRVKADASGLEWVSAGGIGGTISTGQVAFGTALNTIGGDSNLTWDNVLKKLIVLNLKIGTLAGVLKASAGDISGSATTSDLPEGTNLYYTDARARNALSGSAPISYNPSTGVIGLSTPLGFSYGGTGLSTLGTANQLLGVNNAGSALEYKTIQGTANRISVTHSAGVITLSTPQDIDTTSSPTFSGLTIGTLNGILKSTAGVVSAVPAPTGDIVGTSDAQTLTNKRIKKRTSTTTTATSLTPDISAYDLYQFTALESALTINNPTGTPVLGEVLVILIKDNGTSQTLSFGTAYKAMGQALPTATTAGKRMEIIAEYDGTDWLTSYVNEV